MATDQQLREQVREQYAHAASAVTNGSAASCCGPVPGAGLPVTDVSAGSCCGNTTSSTLQLDESFGAGLYPTADAETLPEEALLASLGCGNPIAVADLHEGETVLDLGSGGGIDVLLSARRVGATGARTWAPQAAAWSEERPATSSTSPTKVSTSRLPGPLPTSCRVSHPTRRCTSSRQRWTSGADLLWRSSVVIRTSTSRPWPSKSCGCGCRTSWCTPDSRSATPRP